MKRISNVLTVLFLVTAILTSTTHGALSVSDMSAKITETMRMN